MVVTQKALSIPPALRRACLVAAGLSIWLFPGLGSSASAASAPPPTCSLTGINNGTPAGMQLTAQDPTSGIKNIISPYHLNATACIWNLHPGHDCAYSHQFPLRSSRPRGRPDR